MAKEIPLSQGLVTIVDDEDYDWLNQWKWYAKKSRAQWYACRNNPEADGPRIIRMHRIILTPPGGMFCDHVNRDSLDNRRENLRIATRRQNAQNALYPNAQPRCGVSYSKRRGAWVAYVRYQKQCQNKEEAIETRQKMAKLIREALMHEID